MSPIISNVNIVPNVIDEIAIGGGPPALAGIDNVYSMEFDGTDDYISMGNPAALQITGALTLSAWFKSSYSGGSNERILSKDNNTSRCYMTQLDGSGNAKFYIWNSNSAKIATSTGTDYRDDAWHHIVGVFDPSAIDAQRLALYIDGSNVGYGNTTATTIDNDVVDIEIGRKQDNTLFFDGNIDEVAIWNSALSDIDIERIYNATSAGTPDKTADLNDLSTPPIAWYRMGD